MIKSKNFGYTKLLMCLILVSVLVLSSVGFQPPSRSIMQSKESSDESITSQSSGPFISSVTPITAVNDQTIIVNGSGFGNDPIYVSAAGGTGEDSVYSSTTPSMLIYDGGSGPNLWAAGNSGSPIYNPNPDSTNNIGLFYQSWSNTSITIGGFGSALNGYNWAISAGDPMTVLVFGPNNTGYATYNTSVSSTYYLVTFNETGLLSGTTWSVTLNGAVQSSNSNLIEFNEPNGSYPYGIDSVSGYSAMPLQGNITVNGANVEQRISFISQSFVVKANSSSNQGTAGVTYDGNSSTFTLATGAASQPITGYHGFNPEPSISPNFMMGPVSNNGNEYIGINASETGTVAASAGYIQVYYPFQLNEVYSNYSYEINQSYYGANITLTTSEQNVIILIITDTYTQVTNGLYTYQYAEVNGNNPDQPVNGGSDIQLDGGVWTSASLEYYIASSPGTYSVTSEVSMNDGAWIMYVVALAPVSTVRETYGVYFRESGLPSGVQWSVNLNGVKGSSSTPWVNFTEPNGTYLFSIGNAGNYYPNPSAGTVTINGAEVSKEIYFSKELYLGDSLVNVSGKIFLAEPTANVVSVIDPSTNLVVATIKVGLTPVSLASYSSLTGVPGLSYLSSILIVVNQGSNSVTFINTTTLRVIGNISVGSEPVDVALGYGLAAISNFGSENITVLNVVNIGNGIDSVRKYSVPLSDSPTGLTFDSHTNVLFVSLYNSHKIEEIAMNVDANSYSFSGSIQVMASPLGISMDQNGWLYVADSGSSRLSVIIPNGTIYPAFATYNFSVGSDPVSVAIINHGASQGFQVSAIIMYQDSNNVSFVPVTLLENTHPYVNITYDYPILGIGDFNGSAFMTVNSQNVIAYGSTYQVDFDYNGGNVAYALDGMIIGAPYAYLPAAILLPLGSYNFTYFLESGFQSPTLSTSGGVSLTYASVPSSSTLEVKGAGGITITSSPIPNWVNSGDFNVLPFLINFGEIGPFIINKNLVSYPLEIYVLTPAGGESDQTFENDLNYYFNITVPTSYQSLLTIVLKIPIIGMINSIFGTNFAQKSYDLPLGNYLSFVGIQNVTTSSLGSLDLAVTISSSLNSGQLLKDVLRTVEDDFLSFLKGENLNLSTLLANLNNILGDIINTVDITVTDINSSLQDTGRLSAYTVVDVVSLSNSINKVVSGVTQIPETISQVISTVEKLIGDVKTVMDTPDQFQAWMDLASVTPAPVDLVPIGLAINSAIDGGLHLSDLVLTLADIVWPSLEHNNAYSNFEGMVEAGIEIEDPNGSTTLPSIYVSSSLALGYNTSSGNIVYQSQYGSLQQVGNEFYGYIYRQYAQEMSIVMNNVGGNSSAPYKILVTTNSSFSAFTGMVGSNSSISIPIVINSNGTIQPEQYLVPRLSVLTSDYRYAITVQSYSNTGSMVNASSALLLIGSNQYAMNKINGTTFGFTLPYDMVSSNTIKVYVIASGYAGGYASVYLPLYRINFMQNGLPLGTSWTVSILNATQVSSSNLTVFYEPNGNYTFSIGAVPGYLPSLRAGNIGVNSENSTVEISFTMAKYAIIFTEDGLPNETSWSVSVNGSTESSTLSTISFSLPNGTYNYSVTHLSGYNELPSFGSFAVNGSNVSETVSFTKVVLDGYLIGTISPSNASLYVNGTLYTTNSGQFNISLSPGTYTVKISAIGYETYTTNLTISSSSSTKLPIQSLSKITKPPSIPLLLIVVIVVIVLVAVVAVLAVTLTRNRKKGL